MTAAKPETRTIAETSGFDRPTRRSRRTRAELVAAAVEVLEEEGVGALTVKAVTGRAEVAHGTFYHHFASIDDVLLAVVEDAMHRLSADMAENLATADDKAWVLAGSLATFLSFMSGHAAMGAMVDRPAVLADAIARVVEPFARVDLTNLIDSGEVDSDRTERMANLWHWVIVGALAKSQGQAAAAQRAIGLDVIELVLRSLALAPERVDALLDRVAGQWPVAAKPARPAKTAKPAKEEQAS